MPVVTIAIAAGCLLTLLYVVLMAAYAKGWQQQQHFVLPAEYKPGTFISVIIPARNEAANIGACIDSVLAQKYPLGLYEVIVVDDHSEDGTAAVVHEYADENVRYVSLADHVAPDSELNAYKKAALAAGIKESKGNLIVTTDADCVVPNSWLMHIAALYERDAPVMIVAPVLLESNHDIVQQFQSIDFMSMQGITAAAHQLKLGNMSNGANLAFTKAAYEDVGGYEGITHLASGDDYLLMMKMVQAFPGRIGYLRSPYAVVRAQPQPDWRSFIRQRIRWASKSGKYNDKKLTAVLLLVYLFNLSFAVMLVGGFFMPVLWLMAAGMLAIKTVAEYLFLLPVAKFFDNRWVLKYFAVLQPVHILYIISAGFLGFFGNYTWKGRSVK